MRSFSTPRIVFESGNFGCGTPRRRLLEKLQVVNKQVVAVPMPIGLGIAALQRPDKNRRRTNQNSMRHKLYILAALAIVLAAYTPTASATLQLTLSSGGTTLAIDDNMAGDANAAVGQITFIGAVGNWNLNVSTGTVGQNPLIDLNSVDTLGSTGSGSGANALNLQFSSTGYSVPFNASFVSSIGGTLAVGHSLTYQGWVDTSDTLNGMPAGGLIGSPLTFSNPPAAFAGGTAGGFAAANSSFSLTQLVTLSGTSTGTSSFDAQIDAIPEPASVTLLGGVLLAAFGILRRKMRHA